MDSKGFVIAIDGPVASGKGTLASKLARKINGFYLYTGAMYRCIALMCINNGLDLESEAQVESVLNDLDIELEDGNVLLKGKDVTERIKKPDVASGASVVGVYPTVREAAVVKQQSIAQEKINQEKIVVAEGRDTGTVVFPDSPAKFYLTAKPEVRARRRMEQYGNLSEDDLIRELENLKVRDKRDIEREASPLPDTPEQLGYFILDNSDLSEGETIEKVISELKNRNLIK
jgi:cytidylate kinase